MLINDVVSFAIVTWLAHRRAGVAPLALWRALRPVLIAGVPTWAVARAMVELTGGWPAALGLAASVPIGLATYVAVTTLLDRGVLRQALEQLKRALGAGSRATAPL
jgi:hypothetical protein